MSLKQRVQNTAFWLAAVRWVLPVVLVVVVAALLADTVWLWASGPSDPVPRDSSLPRVEVDNDNTDTRLVEYDQVRDWALFGTWQDQGNNGDDDKHVDAPETRLQLELLGVFQTGDKEGRPGAIIAEQGNKGELYRVGDRVPGNAQLEEVYADRVILRRQGQLETLKLKAPSLSGGIQAAESSSGREESQKKGQPRRGPRGAPGDGPDDEQSSGDGPLSGDVEEQRKRIIRGLSLEGGDEGYVIGDGAPAQLLERAGLQSGDVIVSVNGHDVGNEEADLAALREYHEQGSAQVVIQRGDQRFTLSVPP